MKYYAAINNEYLGKSIKDGSLAIFEEKKDAERVCSKMDYDLIEVSVVKHEKYIRITKENAKLRELIEMVIFEAERNYGEIDIDDLKEELNQIKGPKQ